jgi:hypothetical protein
LRHEWGGEKVEEEGGRGRRDRRGGRGLNQDERRIKKERENNGFQAGLFRPILHKIITLLHPPRFLFRLYLALLPFSFLSIY